MCKICKHKTGSTRHLLYWQAEWAKRFFTTWWHIINRRAYWNWYIDKYFKPAKLSVYQIDEGLRFELDKILGEKGE